MDRSTVMLIMLIVFGLAWRGQGRYTSSSFVLQRGKLHSYMFDSVNQMWTAELLATSLFALIGTTSFVAAAIALKAAVICIDDQSVDDMLSTTCDSFPKGN